MSLGLEDKIQRDGASFPTIKVIYPKLCPHLPLYNGQTVDLVGALVDLG